MDLVDLSAPTLERDGGAAGLTFLPGKRYLGYYSGPHWRDLDSDAASLAELGVDVLLLLVEDHELERCRVTDIDEVVPAHGMELLRLPLTDPVVPANGHAYREALVALVERIRGGHPWPSPAELGWTAPA